MYVYRDIFYVQSPYISLKQEIRYKLPSNQYESIPDYSPKNEKENVISYGPFHSLEVFAPCEVTYIHFPSNAQFRTLEK